LHKSTSRNEGWRLPSNWVTCMRKRQRTVAC